MGFLDSLLWSSIAVGYPLLASVKALMENKSNNDLRKLVAYWIIFFSFSLFELVLEKFLQWIPFWSCIKLGTVCWLVLPQFEQAYSVYSHRIQPILLSIKNYFSKSIERILSREEIFLAMAEKFVKFNGSEAFEDLISRKFPHARKSDVVNEDLKLKIMGAGESVGASVAPDTNENGAEEVVVKTSSKSIETWDIAEPSITNYRGYYRCDICDITMSNVSIFNSHIDGKRHKKALYAYKDGFQCSLCDVLCQNIPSIQSHLKGRKHLDFASKLSSLISSS